MGSLLNSLLAPWKTWLYSKGSICNYAICMGTLISFIPLKLGFSLELPANCRRETGRGFRRALYPIRRRPQAGTREAPALELAVWPGKGLSVAAAPEQDGRRPFIKQPKIDADFLEPSVLLDETHYQEGYKSGYNDGLPSGKEEGRQVGLKMGFQAGEELGFYQGCLDVWMSATCIDQNAFSARVRKNIEQLAALVRSYPLSDPENEQVQDMMEKIRLKFRVITASLGAKLEYEGRLASSKQEIEYL
ncbi:hypothetical protein U9M48_015413 [Paspalum notatum var. saurae]|uniref:Essential protein Yae1 N-terminal domain-containing protein n=1 Tax=Paspalum notatum var. saurae TaxID=547442 RepID=A0AAQ3WLT7_PASNO